MGLSNQSRLLKELRMLQTELPAGIICTPKGETIDRYEARIDGPPDTPYEHGQFCVDIELTPQYPMEPPSVTFRTRIYHPNIDENGNICLEVLKTGKNSGWNPAWTLGKVLISLTLLLANPNPHDPLVSEIAAQMLDDHRAFVDAARRFTEKYAVPAVDEDNDSGDLDGFGADGVGAKPAAGEPAGPAQAPKPAKRRLGLSRKTAAASASGESPSSSAKRPPALGSLGSGAQGIRRLGLSRSRTAAAKPMASSRSASLASTGTVSASQAESVDVASDDGFPEDVGPGELMSPPSKKPRAAGKLSQILGLAKKRSPGRGPRLSLSRPKKQRPQETQGRLETQDMTAAGSDLSVDLGTTGSQDIIGSPPVDDQDMGFECLLSPQDSSGDKHAGQVAVEQTSMPDADLGGAGVSGDSDAGVPEPSDLPGRKVVSRHSDISETPMGNDKEKDEENGRGKDKGKAKDRGKGKGKAVDSGPCSARPTPAPSEEPVLFESHFGPLDLGLPPIKTSAQRRLMRRTKKTS
ncbi:hypothetical protein LPJ56_000475 [Coemansia sp. RSA 2599]|nr:hypothetical protein LPJ75_000149 [Coemansia sp. RSA 2598]KAJ1829299.1 hypothetical protein LPJ56_000475 [Coemansia sp. RSA 2599]